MTDIMRNFFINTFTCDVTDIPVLIDKQLGGSFATLNDIAYLFKEM